MSPLFSEPGGLQSFSTMPTRLFGMYRNVSRSTAATSRATSPPNTNDRSGVDTVPFLVDGAYSILNSTSRHTLTLHAIGESRPLPVRELQRDVTIEFCVAREIDFSIPARPEEGANHGPSETRAVCQSHPGCYCAREPPVKT